MASLLIQGAAATSSSSTELQLADLEDFIHIMTTSWRLQSIIYYQLTKLQPEFVLFGLDIVRVPRACAAFNS